MNLIDSILRASSTVSKNKGKETFLNKKVMKIEERKIGDNYHLYGRVIEGKDEYSTHINYDIKNKVLKSVNCSCNLYEENKKYIKNYICFHIVATAYKYHSIILKKEKLKIKDIKNKNTEAQNKTLINKSLIKEGLSIKELKEEISDLQNSNKVILNNKNSRTLNDRNKEEDKVSNYNTEKVKTIKNNKEEIKIEEKLKLDINIKEEKIKNEVIYYLELRSGKGKTITVDNLGNFLYTLNKLDYTKEDYRVLEFLIKILKKDNKRIIESRKFIIRDKELRILLSLVEKNKMIAFVYDYMTYNTKIIKDNIPYIFTVKKRDNQIILTNQKKMNIPIDKDKNIWIYDKKIYLPSKEQLDFIIPMYQKLKEKNKVVYKYSKESLSKVIYILGKIAKEINIEDNLRDEVNEINKIEFYMTREDNNLYCNFKINYINSLEALKDNKFSEKINMLLEGYKFIKDKDIEKDRYKFIGNEEEEYLFLKEGLNKLKVLGNLKLSDKFKEIRVLDNSSIHMEFREEDKEYYLKYSIDNIGYEEIGTIVNKINRGESFYKSKDGNFLDLENPEVKNFINSLRELNFFKTVYKEELLVDKYQIFHLNQKIMQDSTLDIRGKEVFRNIVEKFKNKEVIYDVPKDLKGNLRDYQVKGYNWLNQISDLGLGGILADDMGLGKTIQTIALILKNIDKKTLIIAPTTLIYNWKNEFDKFTEGLNIGILHGTLKERNKVKEDFESYNVILTTYGTLKNDFDFYEDKTFDYVILDEAQNIKNGKAKTTETVKAIKGECKIALTGTPIENNLLELWSIFDFIMPGFLYRADRFKIEFLNGKEVSIKELKALISPFILRRLKSEVLDELPDKIEKEYLVPMTNMQKQIYNSYLKEFKKDIKESSDNKIVIFSYLTKLRQLCLDPSLIIEEYKEESAKIKLVKDILIKAKENNKKVILFSQFTSVLKKIGGKLEKEKLEYLYLDGSIKSKDRINLVNEFNEGDSNIFLISLKAGGVGLNLTSASMVIHFDPWWNPAVQNQATDRAYRIGQKNVVEVIKLISKDTIEEKIMKLQKEKQELIRNIIDEENLTGETIGSLSKEELIDLFS